MRILISNDDGYKADGIIQLAKSLSEIAEVESTSNPDGKSLTMVLAPNGIKK